MKDKYIKQLDGLRFFAVLMVMIAHWLQWQWGHPIFTQIPFVNGVTLFFVLSGFLITNILLQNRDKALLEKKSISSILKNFYIRRVLRIFPIYYLLLFFLFLINFQETRDLFIWLSTYTINIYQSINNIHVGDFNHFWSLAVEEHFYLFWPVLILFIKPSKTIHIILSTIIISLTCKTFIYFYMDKWMATTYFTISCIHAIGTGALLAYLKIYRSCFVNQYLSKWRFLLGSLLIYTTLFITSKQTQLDWFNILEQFFFSIVAGLVILKASNNGFRSILKFILENKFVVLSGKVSYGMYLYHLFIPTLYSFLSKKYSFGIENKYLQFVLFYTTTFCISYLSWKIIESPINKLKTKFKYLP